MMNDLYLKAYHHLPAAARNIVASLRGFYLREWRYGPNAEKLVEAVLERDQWSANEWKTYIENHLEYVLHRAATKVPYYRQYWANRRLRGDNTGWNYLENWPVLEKGPLRKNPTAFIADDCNVGMMFHEHTSGTTGKPLDLWWSRETVQAWYALFEARCRRCFGVSRKNRWAMLGGQLVTSVARRQPPFWVWNAPLNQLYMSSYHLAPDLIPYYLNALQKYRITYLLGYTSSLYALAQGALRLGRRDIQMAVAITNAEPVYSFQREAIAEAFQCRVQETYGMAEIVAAASECSEGRLHSWPDVGLIEVVPSDQAAVESGDAGDLVCTGLLNVDMPLVRYRVGDRGAVVSSAAVCQCGKSLPLMSAIEGRLDDILYTADGRVLGRLDPVFKANLPIRAAQIIQEALDCVRVRYIPAAGFTYEAAESIIDRLRARMGKVEVILEEVEDIPRQANGKFRAVICNLSPERRKVLGTRNGMGSN